MSQWTPEIADLGGRVHRVTLRLPWALDHVHTYAVAGDDGWTIVDTGLGTPGTARAWDTALAALGSPLIRQIVITHYHPDHIGASAALAALTGAEVVQGTTDAELARGWREDRDLEALERYFLGHGMPAELAAASASDEVGLLVDAAEPTRLVDEGDLIELGSETYSVLVLPGHADGHIALLGERSRTLFGGDVLLQDITPNIGRWSDSMPDPLGKYLDTLDRLIELEPAVVFPGHHRPIEDAPTRAAEIREHHAVGSTSTTTRFAQARRPHTRSPSRSGATAWGSTSGGLPSSRRSPISNVSSASVGRKRASPAAGLLPKA